MYVVLAFRPAVRGDADPLTSTEHRRTDRLCFFIFAIHLTALFAPISRLQINVVRFVVGIRGPRGTRHDTLLKKTLVLSSSPVRISHHLL
jgi:hypothetical protein